MKIRIQGNSIRYRLTRSEVSSLQKSGFIEERTAFNGAHFIYAIKALDNITSLEATFQENTITLLFPMSQNKKWADVERVGYENNMGLEDGQTLRLLLEKDFVCLDERTEDQADNYPNPAAIN
ncbi:hypothetical protein KCTC52924_03956 [Arenibacter antarcticus]|uniref:DUF7009 family protein n=1 Tax=Arenibacter antarcticus TaxID=2040469 RepID=A0ABW5VH20_9FLAO|nr:hypothetical protein [Arenibacter sp. H213]MCM4169757.1 hypothetical protein [Arenibacter sp. H213]